MELIRKRGSCPQPQPAHFARAGRVSAQRNVRRNAGLEARGVKSGVRMSVLEGAFCAGVCSDRTYHQTCSVVGVCERSGYCSNLHGTRSAPVASKKAPGEKVRDQLAPQLSSCAATCCAAPGCAVTLRWRFDRKISPPEKSPRYLIWHLPPQQLRTWQKMQGLGQNFVQPPPKFRSLISRPRHPNFSKFSKEIYSN